MIVVSGGAGYIGSHVVRDLARDGREVLVVDDLRHGHRAAIDGTPILTEDIATARVDWPKVGAVVHLAGLIEVGESMREPEKYYAVNVGAGARFLQAAVEGGVKRIVFSSTAAVYGDPEATPISETHPVRPASVYGRTKLVIEWLLADLAARRGVSVGVLRYFNAAGDDEDHRPETHLIPRLLGGTVEIYGDDYPTPDGTCLRDFVHVDDLARAHRLMLDRLERIPGMATVNLGSGRGWSVREVIDRARSVTGRAIEVRVGPRRPGDPPRLVADITRAREELDWEPTRPLDEMIRSAWEWRRGHPDGYGE